MPIRFRPVLYAMVEPDLKLIVSAGAMRESYIANFIELQINPNMDPAHLTQPKNERDQAFWRLANSSEPPEELVGWRNFSSVWQMMCVQHVKGTTLFVDIPDTGGGLSLIVAAMKRMCGNTVAGREYQVICAALAASAQLPAFSRDARSYHGTEVTSVVVRLERSLAREIARNCDWQFDSLVQQFVYLAEFDL